MTEPDQATIDRLNAIRQKLINDQDITLDERAILDAASAAAAEDTEPG